jgi:hypothetical protein
MLTRNIVETTIGKTFADKLDEVIFEVSPKLTFTRRQMVEDLGCANFNAAALLQKALRKLSVETPAQLFRTDPFSIVRIKGIGETAMFVAMCILDYAQYNVQEWWGWKETNTLKFSSFKHNAIRRATKRGKHDI